MIGSPFVLAPLALVGGALSVESLLARREARRTPPPGRMVDVGGRELHVRMLGSGDPVIVLEAGAGEWSSHWGRLPEELAHLSTVIAYDRAGLGWSDRGPEPRTAETAAVELRELLRRLVPRRRVLLVGHGWGAHVLRLFAHRYPFELAGLVFVDGQREELELALSRAGLPSIAVSTREVLLLALLGRLGILRLAGYSPLNGVTDLGLPESSVGTIAALARSPRVLAGVRAEVAGARASDEAVARLEARLEVPVRALVAGASLAVHGVPEDFPRDEFNRVWRELGVRFGDLSDDSAVEVVDGADHLLPLRAPQRVVAAVAGALEAVRQV